MTKDSFILYHSFYEHIEDLSDEDIGKLTRAIFIYEKENKEIELSPVLKMAFSFIRKQLDLNKEKYQEKCKKNKENGFKGGRPQSENNPNKPNGFLKKQPDKNKPDSVSDTDSVSDSEYESDKRDIFVCPEIEKIFSIYAENCNNLAKLGFEKRNNQIRQQIIDFLEETNDDFEYFREICKLANSLKEIAGNKIDLKMILNNHIGIKNGKYETVKTTDVSKIDFS